VFKGLRDQKEGQWRPNGDLLRLEVGKKLWVKRHDLVRTRHSGVVIKLKIFLKYIAAVPISSWIM